MEKKESYRQELEAKLKKWKVMIDDLATKAEKTKKESEAVIKRQVEELRDKFDTVEKRIGDLKEGGSEAWQTIKIGIEKAAGDLKESLDAVVGTKDTSRMIVRGKKKKPLKRKEKSAKMLSVKTTALKKQYLKTKNVCRVTFRLPRAAAPEAKSVCLVGDFNNWSIHAHPMNKLKNGSFTIALDLEPGKEYQFRYLIDDVMWENDWHADKYVKSPYGDSDNSVVIV